MKSDSIWFSDENLEKKNQIRSEASEFLLQKLQAVSIVSLLISKKCGGSTYFSFFPIRNNTLIYADKGKNNN